MDSIGNTFIVINCDELYCSYYLLILAESTRKEYTDTNYQFALKIKDNHEEPDKGEHVILVDYVTRCLVNNNTKPKYIVPIKRYIVRSILKPLNYYIIAPEGLLKFGDQQLELRRNVWAM